MSYKNPVTGLYPVERANIRYAVQMAVAYWPNAHLGEQTPRQDIRNAFRRLRNEMGVLPPNVAATNLLIDAYRHQDM